MQGNKQLKVAALAEKKNNNVRRHGASNYAKMAGERQAATIRRILKSHAAKNASKKKGGGLLSKFKKWRTRVTEKKTRKAEVNSLKREYKTLKLKNKRTNKNTERLENIKAMLQEVGENVNAA